MSNPNYCGHADRLSKKAPVSSGAFIMLRDIIS